MQLFPGACIWLRHLCKLSSGPLAVDVGLVVLEILPAAKKAVFQTISVDKVLFQGLRERAPMAEGDHALWEDESLGKVSVNQ